jgi:ribonuclease Z
MKILKSLLVLIALTCIGIAVHAKEPSRMTVVLLGTGTPNPSPDRFGPATLVQAGNLNLLFDTGRGVTVRLWQLGIPLGRIDQVFLTHFHSDHTNGLPDLWLTGWLSTAYAGRKTSLNISGPTGVKALTAGLEKAYADDIRMRLADEKLPPEAIGFNVKEFPEGDGVVFERDGVTVTSFKNFHGEHIHPSVGYRVDYMGRSVLISGDTRFSDNTIKYGKGVDLLIHEVASGKPELLKENPNLLPILEHHTTPQEAGRIFTDTKPKLAVYSHLVFLANKKFPAMTVEDLRRATRETYDGPLQIGEDLMRFDIADKVSVVPWVK